MKNDFNKIKPFLILTKTQGIYSSFTIIENEGKNLFLDLVQNKNTNTEKINLLFKEDKLVVYNINDMIETVEFNFQEDISVLECFNFPINSIAITMDKYIQLQLSRFFSGIESDKSCTFINKNSSLALKTQEAIPKELSSYVISLLSSKLENHTIFKTIVQNGQFSYDYLYSAILFFRKNDEIYQLINQYDVKFKELINESSYEIMNIFEDYFFSESIYKDSIIKRIIKKEFTKPYLSIIYTIFKKLPSEIKNSIKPKIIKLLNEPELINKSLFEKLYFFHIATEVYSGNEEFISLWEKSKKTKGRLYFRNIEFDFYLNSPNKIDFIYILNKYFPYTTVISNEDIYSLDKYLINKGYSHDGLNKLFASRKK